MKTGRARRPVFVSRETIENTVLHAILEQSKERVLNGVLYSRSPYFEDHAHVIREPETGEFPSESFDEATLTKE